jgi:hypothetical protein
VNVFTNSPPYRVVGAAGDRPGLREALLDAAGEVGQLVGLLAFLGRCHWPIEAPVGYVVYVYF